MTTDYTKMLKGYPTYMSMEQMRIACHISKRTARFLLESGLVPCKNTGKKTHTYRIRKAAIHNYLVQRDIMPERYILPENSYARSSTMPDYNNCNIITVDLSLAEEYPDVLKLRQAASLSRVMPDTVLAWVRNGYVKAFRISNAYYIPKQLLLEYLKSPRHRRNFILKQNNMEKRQQSKENKNALKSEFD